MAQGAKGRSRQAGPSGQSTNQTSREHVKGAGGQPHENRMPFLAMNYCIALQGIFPSRN